MSDDLTTKLKDIMINDQDALSLIVKIGGVEYEVGLMYRMNDEKNALDVVSEGSSSGVASQYAVRRVSVWRPVGSDWTSAPLFPVVGYSSLRQHFIVLDEKLTRNQKRKPIKVESIRYATCDEQTTEFIWDELALEKILKS